MPTINYLQHKNKKKKDHLQNILPSILTKNGGNKHKSRLQPATYVFNVHTQLGLYFYLVKDSTQTHITARRKKT